MTHAALTHAAAPNEIEIVYRDEWLLVANKPAGLLAVPGRGADKQDCLISRIQQAFPDALIVHRLDMATSGLLVLALGIEMQRRLSQLFREREVEKRYLAVVHGSLQDPVGEIDLPIGSDWPNRPKQQVNHISGKRSLTRYRLLSHEESINVSRVELEPVTGRTHQLRVHLAAIGHPIVGDTLYGHAADGQAQRLLLHARQLSFIHPVTGTRLTLCSHVSF
ncbi:MAG: RluA family pseudouridine synthase [Nitrosomonadales bacterium]|nr:RluA family pseudouridine synthase [Nitrosomonadales bacterium]